MKPQDVTKAMVVEVALQSARDNGITATSAQCQVKQHPTSLAVMEGGGPTTVPNTVWRWEVFVSGQPLVAGGWSQCWVLVEFVSGEIADTDFRFLS
jgi:hypothetical protein